MLNLHKTKDKQEILRDTREGKHKNKAPCLSLLKLFPETQQSTLMNARSHLSNPHEAVEDLVLQMREVQGKRGEE